MPDSTPLLDHAALCAAAAACAARAVPPAWPLAATVAVNPFLGQAGEDLAHAAARLARVAGVRLAMPRRWYARRIADGRIAEADLAAAWAQAPAALRPASLAALTAAAAVDRPAPDAVPTVAELAARASGIDWPGLVADRIGAWAAAFFDEGQALWAAPRGAAWAAWRAFATHDLTPEIAGLRGFAAQVQALPDDAAAAIAGAARRLAIGPAALETAFHRLLMTLGGWAQLARGRQWQAGQRGETDATPEALLAIRLAWDAALFRQYQAPVADAWQAALARHAAPVAPTPDDAIDAILQDAADRAAQRALAAMLARAPTAASPTAASPAAASPTAAPGARPRLQAVFCIDVRSEVMRRALEGLDPGIRTLGFAGFFGLGTAHRRFASAVAEHRLPVLLAPVLRSCAAGERTRAEGAARVAARARRAWGRFKAAAVSSFAFVEATGPLHLVGLVRDALGLRGPAQAEPPPRLDPVPDLAARVDSAAAVLRAMGLSAGFARLVLLVGHGAGVVNNPFASALQCGACGGHAGDVNARLLADLLNDDAVRGGLAARGLVIPADTLFVAGLHDTTADAVVLYAGDRPSPAHRADLDRARAWLAAAGARARTERARRLPGDGGAAARPAGLRRRGRDWAQIRPEWGLAGCSAFIAAPRACTAGRDLAGRAFLHDYDWTADAGFAVLELILTAPVVVASWISLQYYGSTVAPAAFGAGDKLLHNVTGGVGVVEGAGGVLRAGLPWQSVHDGRDVVHEPLRLAVCVAAPRDAIAGVLRRHPDVARLFDNRWLHLFALDDRGRMAWRYAGTLAWDAVDEAPQVPAAA